MSRAVRDGVVSGWRPELKGTGRLVHGPGRLWPWPRRPGVREEGQRHGSVTKAHG
ncbi:MAG: hypothetical protein JWO14_1455, partial [Solirubrobacterales bacterium]|nr:hypothetical protein [Solirubrobacterales bacterium]